MKKHSFSFQQTGHFSKIFLDYIAHDSRLVPFCRAFPTPENIVQQIDIKPFSPEKRQILHQALSRQYQHTPHRPQLALDLLLQDNTYTLTTGHQLCIFTGPLYFHYKIMTVIKAAQQLRKQYPNYHFVPVYWMASEDHDFEEIRAIRLFNKKYAWQYSAQGAVGHLPTESLADLIKEMPEMDSFLAEAYSHSATLAEATRLIVNELYGNEGLVVIDGDDPDLKRLFLPTVIQELTEQPTEKLVKTTSEQLEQEGYKAQVFPRPINLFYLREGLRERIEKQEAGYQVINTNIRFSETEMISEATQYPERFSPNVVLRPLYQETILPNLAYTGGPGELAYWFQLKGVFDHFQVPFPILLPRNFLMILTQNHQNRLQKLGLSIAQLFVPFADLKAQYVHQNTTELVSLVAETTQINQLFDQIIQKVSRVDVSLKGFAEAEKQRLEKSLDTISKKTRKAEEQKHETALKQMENLLESLFPEGSLQEREDNFLNFYLNDRNFLIKLMDTLDPFDFNFTVYEWD